MKQYYCILFLIFTSLLTALMWIMSPEEMRSIKRIEIHIREIMQKVGSLKFADTAAAPTLRTVRGVLLELSKEFLRSGVKIILTQAEDLSDERDFVKNVFLNIDDPVTRVGVFSEHFDVLNTAIKKFLRYCTVMQRKDIVIDDPRAKSKTKKSSGKITTHVFLIIPLNDTSLAELEESSKKDKDYFNWKRIHFQIIYKRGVSTKDQPEGYRWIGEERDDTFGFRRPAESYEAFATRPIRGGEYENLFEVPFNKRFFVWEKEAAEFKECPVHSEADKKKFQDKAKGKKVTDAETIRKYMTSIMAVKRLMQRHRMRSWLNCGTLLGWYRQCSLIPGDSDIDLMHFVNPDAYPSIHADILKQKDVFHLADRNIVSGKHFNNKGTYWILGVKSGVKVDTFMINSHKVVNLHGKGMFIDFTDKICSADLHGFRVYVLCSKHKDILKVNYGSDMMTPS